MPDAVRPTKKQRELLEFIEAFIGQHGYSPSYREIMAGCHYTSIATVALHVNSLITRGHLVKRGRSARSLELTDAKIEEASLAVGEISEQQTKWLVQTVKARFEEVQQGKTVTQKQVDELYVLVGALKVLGLQDAATSFMPHLKDLRTKT